MQDLDDDVFHDAAGRDDEVGEDLHDNVEPALVQTLAEEGAG